MGPPAALVVLYCGWSLSQMFLVKESKQPPANVFPLYAPSCSRLASTA